MLYLISAGLVNGVIMMNIYEPLLLHILFSSYFK